MKNNFKFEIRHSAFDIRKPYDIVLPGGVLKTGPKTLLMGVLNVTPDSFSDGGKFYDPEAAVAQGIWMAEEGVDILDVGGESTRPGADPLALGEELRRVIPVIAALRARLPLPISIDTYKAEVARQAIAAGADMVNDISSLRFDERMADVVRNAGVAVVLMHMRGTPKTMHELPPSPDIVTEVKDGLAAAVHMACERGIDREKIIIDPGIGFGKNTEENLKLINNLSLLSELNLPILIGTSRKRFIGNVLGLPVEQRLIGTVATVAATILRGAHIVRVHDVKPTRETASIIDAILRS
jgi:dihydropteroate synthase